MSDNQKYFETLILEIDDAELGNLFGKPCGKINKKAFVSFFEDEMVFKIGKEAVDKLLEAYKGSQKWDPSGKKRPMKDWIQIPGKFKSNWKELTAMAIEFYKSQ